MPTAPAKRENLLLNIVFNVLLPSFLLSWLSKPERFGPVWGLIIALSFPLGYGIWDFIRRRQTNFISVIGFGSVLLTGIFALVHVNRFWFAVKEAAIPSVIGIAILASLKSKRPLVRQLLYNDQVIDVPRIDAVLATRGAAKTFDRHLREASVLLALSFLISAILNFGLARYLIRSDTGTPEFNAELGKMNFWSWPVIVVPSMAMMMFALWRLIKGITRLTGLTSEEIFRAKDSAEDKAKAEPESPSR
ncbi:MAG TPA: VC0807 family protein [Opitutaceae bacterium]|nr:VC0807 family protein [Opitutaceae bacterium]